MLGMRILWVLFFCVGASACPHLASLGKQGFRRAPQAFRESVRVHDLLADQISFPQGLIDVVATVGFGGPRGGYQNPEVRRLRDAEPFLHFRSASPESGEVIEFTHPRLSSPTPISFRANPQAIDSPGAPGTEPYLIGTNRYDWPTRRVPVFLTGADFLRTSEYLLLSNKVFSDNARLRTDWIEELEARLGYSSSDTSHVTAYRWMRLFGESVGRQYEPLSAEQTLNYLTQAFNLPTEKVLIFSAFPGDRTGRLDNLIGTFGPEHVAVPYIPLARASKSTSDAEQAFLDKTNSILDRYAYTLEKAKLTVLRAPMPRPLNFEVRDNVVGGVADFISPVNWVIKEGTIYLPIDSGVLQAMETSAETFYQPVTSLLQSRYGFRVEWVDLRAQVRDHGGLRAITSDWVAPR